MKRGILAAVVLILAASMLQAQSIYVDGNNEAAAVIEKEIPKVTPYKIAENRKRADYVLKVNEKTISRGLAGGFSTVWLKLQDQKGNNLWRGGQNMGIRYVTGIKKLLKRMLRSGKIK